MSQAKLLVPKFSALSKPRELRATFAPRTCPLRVFQRILLVEDSQSIRRLCSKVLMRSGYQVDTAEDGEAGLRALRAARHDPDSFDLLITDNEMPRLSGLDLIQQLHIEHLDLPVILASGSVPAQTEQLRLAAILPKPFSADQLLQVVNEILN